MTVAEQESAEETSSISQEAALVDYVEKLHNQPMDRLAVHIHLSRLQPYNRRDHHVRVAALVFESLVRQYEGRIFSLRNSDLIFIVRGVSPYQLDEAVTRLRYLFAEDPLTISQDPASDSGFCTWFRLDRDYANFLSRAKQIQLTSIPGPADDNNMAAPAPRMPITAADLAALEATIRNVDLEPLIRSQPVCAFIPGQQPKVLFREIYVSIQDLGTQIAPGRDLGASKWLFQHLTQTLDRRMLAHLGRDSENQDSGYSINLNVATILSPEFQKFDQSISARLRGRLVIELQKIDVFADMGAFRFARDYLHERGYRVCLDGLTHLTIPYIDREKMGFDLVKMFWSPEVALSARPGLLKDVRDTLAAWGTARMILARCDSEQAMDVGRSFGVTLFQGRYVDKVAQQLNIGG